MIKFYKSSRRVFLWVLLLILILGTLIWKRPTLDPHYSRQIELKINEWTKQTRISVDFDQEDSAAAKALEKLREDKLKMDMQRNHELWEINPDLEGKLPLNVTIPRYFYDKRLTLPPVQPFDPRFNIGVFLNYVIMQSKNKGDKSQYKLPFNWVDWVDTSVLNKYILFNEKPTCNQLFLLPQDIIDTDFRYRKPESYCKEDSKSSHGFRVFGSPGVQNTWSSIIAGKSYLANEMPTPLKVVFLGSSGIDLVQFEVEKSEKSIINNGVVQQLIKNGQVNTSIDLGEAYGEVEATFIDHKKNNLPYKRELKKESFLLSPKSIVKLWEERKQTRDEKEEKDLKKDTKADSKENGKAEKQPQPIPSKEKDPKKEQQAESKGNGKAQKQALPNPDMSQAKNFPKTPSVNLAKPETLNQDFINGLKGSLANKDDSQKYFTETILAHTEALHQKDFHYDWRFFNGFSKSDVQYEHESIIIHQLARVWLKFTQSNNIDTWLAHGSLLSWYWNGMAFPWDSDLDFQMSIEDLYKLAAGFNQSVIVENILDHTGAFQGVGRYFLEVGSSITVREKNSGQNNIDARLIDLDSGIFLDVTGLSVSDLPTPDRYIKESSKDYLKFLNFERNRALQVYNCKNLHFSSFTDLSPLILTTIDNLPVYIPYKFKEALENEYRSHSLENENFSHYYYMANLRMWVETQKILDYLDAPKQYVKTFHKRAVGAYEKYKLTRLNLKQHIDFLERNVFLAQYELGHNIAKNHEHEIKLLNAKDFEASEKFLRGNLKANSKPLRKDVFLYKYFKDNWRWDRAVLSLLELVVVYEGGKGRALEPEIPTLTWTKEGAKS